MEPPRRQVRQEKGDFKRKPIILMIDDSESETHWLLLDFAAKEGYNLLELIKRGKEGLEKAKETKPDFVFIDRNTPDMNSVELIRQIRQILPNSTVVIMSRTNELEWILACKDAGANEILTKPFPLNHLYALFDIKA